MRALATPLRFFRTYATNRRPRLDAALSLDHFIQRTRVLSFYRAIIRSTRKIPDTKTRAETRKFVRDEFERHRDVKDLGHIRYLLSTGKTEWENMERYINGM
ncbi:hypothetical protein MYCTH_2309010 [Thermothelomyces thermophilus ATCC 42464]|uniref:LYR motif-containing protein 2 n=1 Tax=Thermothelomyces thermophilus (strain ATCC 42464 / BCRC 31852 / DSM 1799) TaxID=573729 RepID=G2QKM3_THET4|nr:uncharacterized protein MYCTH_2309010 [Thermothelomyces thermophilus ATCC 42464]AEO60129.1 hypothetical protein MYCTH_2309010 [Thermothelomyces thermophilus ATCC 42464]